MNSIKPAYIGAIILCIFAFLPAILFYGLFVPWIMFCAAVFSCVILIGLIVERRIHIPAAILVIGFLILIGAAFLPPYFDARNAISAEDHLRAGEAYAQRAQVFGDSKATFQQYLIAAQMGSAEAQYRVGSAFLYRHYGQPHDLTQARYWLELAASQGDDRAKKDLANPYHFKGNKS